MGRTRLKLIRPLLTCRPLAREVLEKASMFNRFWTDKRRSARGLSGDDLPLTADGYSANNIGLAVAPACWLFLS